MSKVTNNVKSYKQVLDTINVNKCPKSQKLQTIYQVSQQLQTNKCQKLNNVLGPINVKSYKQC